MKITKNFASVTFHITGYFERFERKLPTVRKKWIIIGAETKTNMKETKLQ